jgi:predicted nucleic acid-binding protein
MTVIDASAFLEVLLRPGSQPYVEELVKTKTAIAPSLFDAEVLSRLVKNEKRGLLSASHVRKALTVLRAAPVARVSHERLLLDAWRCSGALSAYDALYVALAAQLGVGLVTADGRLARAPDLGVPITLVSAN